MASNEVMNAQPENLGMIDEAKGYLYEELWKLCAGPLFDLPKDGEQVYYFPQGHIEHLESSLEEGLDKMKPLFDLPSKLQCNVIGVQLKVENDTDEVYAQITLLPEIAQSGVDGPNENQERETFHAFAKVLTASDTSTHGGFSIPRKHATECLPPLDMSQLTPSQEIVAKDMHGYEWRFKHIFRGTPRRHLFTSGWSAFVTAKRLAVGDSFIFIRGENGESRVGIRRAAKQHRKITSSVISTENIYHGVTTSLLNVIKTKCMFTVFHKPRSSQFVVNYQKFVDAVNNKFNVGSRFTMRFEDEDFNEIKYIGTIVGYKDFSPYWKHSEWRSLQVQWDENAPILRPSKVSPWEIESLMPLLNVPQSAFFKNKRSRQVNEIGLTSSNLQNATLIQGQEIGQSSISSMLGVPQLSYHDPTEGYKISSGYLTSCSVSNMPNPNYTEQMVRPMKEKMVTDAIASCRLFGVDLTSPLETKGPTDSHQNFEMFKLSQETKLGPIETLSSLENVQTTYINSTRSRTKVHMQGVAIGRTVDLTVFDGYNQLIEELEKLFDLEGELRTRNHWEIVFTDYEEDMMLLGDAPWIDFCNIVKKIFICSKEKFMKMNIENKFYKSESTLTTTSFEVPPGVQTDYGGRENYEKDGQE